MEEFFEQDRPKELGKALYEALRFRWGFEDHAVYSLKEAAQELTVEPEDLFMAEVSFLNRLGWQIRHDGKHKSTWLRS